MRKKMAYKIDPWEKPMYITHPWAAIIEAGKQISLWSLTKTTNMSIIMDQAARTLYMTSPSLFSPPSEKLCYYVYHLG